jgi:hypothetical protein
VPPLLHRWQARRCPRELAGIHSPGRREKGGLLELSASVGRERYGGRSSGPRGIRLSGPTVCWSATTNRQWKRPIAIEVTIAFKLNIVMSSMLYNLRILSSTRVFVFATLFFIY